MHPISRRAIGFPNTGRMLAAAGYRPDQVATLTICLANYRREHLDNPDRLFG